MREPMNLDKNNLSSLSSKRKHHSTTYYELNFEPKARRRKKKEKEKKNPQAHEISISTLNIRWAGSI